MDATTYHYEVSGVAQFPSGAVVYAELLTPGDPSEVLFSGLAYPAEPGSSTLTSFTYDPQEATFSFEPGDFSSGDLYLHMWVEVGGIIYDELYYHQ